MDIVISVVIGLLAVLYTYISCFLRCLLRPQKDHIGNALIFIYTYSNVI